MRAGPISFRCPTVRGKPSGRRWPAPRSRSSSPRWGPRTCGSPVPSPTAGSARRFCPNRQMRSSTRSARGPNPRVDPWTMWHSPWRPDSSSPTTSKPPDVAMHRATHSPSAPWVRPAPTSTTGHSNGRDSARPSKRCNASGRAAIARRPPKRCPSRSGSAPTSSAMTRRSPIGFGYIATAASTRSG